MIAGVGEPTPTAAPSLAPRGIPGPGSGRVPQARRSIARGSGPWNPPAASRLGRHALSLKGFHRQLRLIGGLQMRVQAPRIQAETGIYLDNGLEVRSG